MIGAMLLLLVLSDSQFDSFARLFESVCLNEKKREAQLGLFLQARFQFRDIFPIILCLYTVAYVTFAFCFRWTYHALPTVCSVHDILTGRKSN